MVQALTHAFEHREGWLQDGAIPPGMNAAKLLGGGFVVLSIMFILHCQRENLHNHEILDWRFRS